jgi:hypothetical protein
MRVGFQTSFSDKPSGLISHSDFRSSVHVESRTASELWVLGSESGHPADFFWQNSTDSIQCGRAAPRLGPSAALHPSALGCRSHQPTNTIFTTSAPLLILDQRFAAAAVECARAERAAAFAAAGSGGKKRKLELASWPRFGRGFMRVRSWSASSPPAPARAGACA